MKPISIGRRVVVDLDLLRRGAGIRVVDGQRQAAFGKRELHRAAALRGDRRDAVDGLGELVPLDGHELVVAGRDDALIVREGAVDQFRGQHDAARPSGAPWPGTARRARSRSPPSTSFWISATALRGMITPGMPSEPFGAGSISTRARRCPSVATARSAVRAALVDGVEVDAVQIVARLLRRDRELGLVDEALQVAGLEAEAVRQFARREVREVALGQRLQHEARAAGADLHLGRVAAESRGRPAPLPAACGRSRR